MSVFVLIHGAWGGGWQWRGVANGLRALGHEVYAPTLTGLGERSHLGTASTGLTTHIDDVAGLIWFEDLRDVVLVGWSYGAAIAEGVADVMPDQLRMVVNLDGDLAVEGRAKADSWDADDPDWPKIQQGIPVSPPTADEMADNLDDAELRRWVAERLRPHPGRAWIEPFPTRGGRRASVPHVLVECSLRNDDKYKAKHEQLVSDPAWVVREVPLNHLGLLYDPATIATTLDDLADD